jgi:hypothetical protein
MALDPQQPDELLPGQALPPAQAAHGPALVQIREEFLQGGGLVQGVCP